MQTSTNRWNIYEVKQYLIESIVSIYFDFGIFSLDFDRWMSKFYITKKKGTPGRSSSDNGAERGGEILGGLANHNRPMPTSTSPAIHQNDFWGFWSTASMKSKQHPCWYIDVVLELNDGDDRISIRNRIEAEPTRYKLARIRVVLILATPALLAAQYP
jgi:hypothetical protein